MALVAAKCTQCGGNIEVDDQKDAAICPFCGTPYIVEQAINNYNITNNNHIHANVVNIVNQNGGGDTADSLYKTCLECCKRDCMQRWLLLMQSLNRNIQRIIASIT